MRLSDQAGSLLASAWVPRYGEGSATLVCDHVPLNLLAIRRSEAFASVAFSVSLLVSHFFQLSFSEDALAEGVLRKPREEIPATFNVWVP